MPRRTCALIALGLSSCLLGASPPPRPADPFAGIELPDAWEAKFWATEGVAKVVDLEPKALAALVPEQAGLRHCRCPHCPAPESSDPLVWRPDKPNVLTCRACKTTIPNDEYPAKVDKKVPEESVEVLPRKFHKYPYHVVEAEAQLYPDERLYLAAKRDYEAREFLAKLALYAAVRYREAPPEKREAKLGRAAGVLLIRFAQVYPAYATHYDQPHQPKYFGPANLGPPYRRDYGTGKWDWTGCLDVPLNLVIAYSILRDDPSLIEAGKALDVPHPTRLIERDLFRASAEFVANQPEEYSESSLLAYRGMLAVGRLLDDRPSVVGAEERLEEFVRRGFYHDGLWRRGDLRAHRRILDQIDGWFGRLLPPEMAPKAERALSLARFAEATVLMTPPKSDVLRVSWPSASPRAADPHPALLGGSGIARLSVGRGPDALDLELRGLGDLGGQAHTDRLALRVAVAGRPVLGDLDDAPPLEDGWDRSSVSHNLVVVDGLNQRESPGKARVPAPGSDILFFAADPDFQVATMEDRLAYPGSTSRYRQTLVASSGARSRYAVSVFEAVGGLQHDLLFHGATSSLGRWRVALPMGRGPRSLLPEAINYLPNATAAEGRWFVQAFGALDDLSQGQILRPSQAILSAGGPGVKLHLFTEYRTPATLVSGRSPDQDGPTDPDAPGRGSLVLRVRSAEGSSLRSTFVTVFEPVGSASPPLVRVGRVPAGSELVVLYVETSDGPEHVVINLTPGTARTARLADGTTLTTDGLVARLLADRPRPGRRDLRRVGRRQDHPDPRRRLDPQVGTGRRPLRDARLVRDRYPAPRGRDVRRPGPPDPPRRRHLTRLDDRARRGRAGDRHPLLCP